MIFPFRACLAFFNYRALVTFCATRRNALTRIERLAEIARIDEESAGGRRVNDNCRRKPFSFTRFRRTAVHPDGSPCSFGAVTRYILYEATSDQASMHFSSAVRGPVGPYLTRRSATCAAPKTRRLCSRAGVSSSEKSTPRWNFYSLKAPAVAISARIAGETDRTVPLVPVTSPPPP